MILKFLQFLKFTENIIEILKNAELIFKLLFKV